MTISFFTQLNSRLSLPNYYDLYSGIFTDAIPGSIFEQIYRAKVAGHENSFFVNESDGLEKIVANENSAVFYNIESFADKKTYQCQIVAPWVTLYPGLLSVAFPKDSEYFPFIQYQTMRLLDQGTSSRAWNAIVRDMDSTCETTKLSGLGVHKLVSLFGLLGLAGVLSVTILIVERTVFYKRVVTQDKVHFESPNQDVMQLDWQPQIDWLVQKFGIDDKFEFSRHLSRILFTVKRQPVRVEMNQE